MIGSYTFYHRLKKSDEILFINLIRHMWDLRAETTKSWWKINEELNKWRDTLVSLIRELNTAKILVPPKLIYWFNAIPISIVALVFWFMIFLVLLRYNWQNRKYLKYTTWWFDICIRCQIVTTIKLTNIFIPWKLPFLNYENAKRFSLLANFKYII